MAQLDECDMKKLSRFEWAVTEKGRPYAYTLVGGQRVFMHNAVLKRKGGFVVDHINGDTLDNRRSNLRHATVSQNGANRGKPNLGKRTSSQYKGVTKARGGLWCASAHRLGKTHFFGHFDNESDAARAYDIGARELFGEFSRPNFPDAPADWIPSRRAFDATRSNLRMSEPQIKDAIEMRNLGLSWSAIGENLGLNRTTVQNTLMGRTKKASAILRALDDGVLPEMPK